MITAGLVGDGTGRRCGYWRHVATGCNALVHYKNSVHAYSFDRTILRKQVERGFTVYLQHTAYHSTLVYS